jgi:oligoribonuclease
MDKQHPLLVWMDLEMSGLDAHKERILEAAALITNSDLELVAAGPNLVIHQPEEVLEAMDEWNQQHHGDSGLIARVRASTITQADAEAALLEFVSAHCERGKAPLVGNSIHHDRWFLKLHMPALEAYFHYRIIDISSIKELCRRWYPTEFAQMPEKKKAHRALDDILESVEELRAYRRSIFR